MEDRQSLEDTFTAYARALRLGVKPAYIFGLCPFAASSMYSALENMTCDQHFLDLPIAGDLDAANRSMIASDPELFGAYFRPRIDVSPTNLQGVDEFSSLAEAAAVPVLELAKDVGGMLQVYDREVPLDRRHNLAAGAAAHRLVHWRAELAGSSRRARRAAPPRTTRCPVGAGPRTTFDVGGGGRPFRRRRLPATGRSTRRTWTARAARRQARRAP